MACSGSKSNDEIKHRILKVYTKFVSDVEPDRLSDWLVQEEVITIDEKQRIRNTNHITSDRCRALLDHLFAIHHPRAFLIVREALSERNHHLLKYIDNQESEWEFRVQSDTETSSQDKKKIEQLEKDNEDQRRAREDEQDRLLKMHKEHEDKKGAWAEEKDRLLKTQKELETKLNLKESDLQSNRRSEQSPISEQSNEIELLRKENRKLKQELEATKSDKLRYKSDPVLSYPVLVHTIRSKAEEGGKKGIHGLTILDKELFVVSGSSSEVEIYDSIKLSFSRRWNLNELIHLWDIGSCDRNKCLYIFDTKYAGHSKEILRVDPNGNLIKKWSTGDNYGRLSVTSESNIILTVFWKNRLNEYSPDGQLIREINLSSDAGIRYPRHAIKLSNGHFVVSHGFYDGDLHRVCVVDADGNLKKSFGEQRGSDIGQMNCPVYMAVDKNGFVMVSDTGNSRVLLLDSDLEFKREILSEEKLGSCYASKILLDESNDRVLVADNGWDSEKKMSSDGQILIFDF